MADAANDSEVAERYRQAVRASGDSAEWAAIDGMPDGFVAALARGDFAAATAALAAL